MKKGTSLRHQHFIPLKTCVTYMYDERGLLPSYRMLCVNQWCRSQNIRTYVSLCTVLNAVYIIMGALEHGDIKGVLDHIDSVLLLMYCTYVRTYVLNGHFKLINSELMNTGRAIQFSICS